MYLQFPYSRFGYVAFVVLGCAVGLAVSRRRRSPLPMPREYYIVVLGAAAAGGYLVSLVHRMLGIPDEGSRSVMSALFCGWIAAEGIKLLSGIRRPTGEPLAIGLPLALGIGRLGCLFGHCCLGVPYTGPFALVVDGGAYVPIPVLEAGFHLISFFVQLLFQRFNVLAGWRLRFYLVSYSVFRFATEAVRPHPQLALHLTAYQWMAALLTMGIGAVALLERGQGRAEDTAVK